MILQPQLKVQVDQAQRQVLKFLYHRAHQLRFSLWLPRDVALHRYFAHGFLFIRQLSHQHRLFSFPPRILQQFYTLQLADTFFLILRVLYTLYDHFCSFATRSAWGCMWLDFVGSSQRQCLQNLRSRRSYFHGEASYAPPYFPLKAPKARDRRLPSRMRWLWPNYESSPRRQIHYTTLDTTWFLLLGCHHC